MGYILGSLYVGNRTSAPRIGQEVIILGNRSTGSFLLARSGGPFTKLGCLAKQIIGTPRTTLLTSAPLAESPLDDRVLPPSSPKWETTSTASASEA